MSLKANLEFQVRLVAVSKLKPATDVLALHEGPTKHKHFGENYAQELTEKAEMLPSSIKWHFIGGLQTSRLTIPSFLLEIFVVIIYPLIKLSCYFSMVIAYVITTYHHHPAINQALFVLFNKVEGFRGIRSANLPHGELQGVDEFFKKKFVAAILPA